MRRAGGLLVLAMLVTPVAQAAIAYRSQTSAASVTGTTDVVTEPAGAANGDVLVACVQQSDGTPIGTPAGWTTLYGAASASASSYYWFGYIARGASAPSLTWTFVSGSYRSEAVQAFSGVSTGTPVNVSAQQASNITTAAPQAPAAVATVTNTWAVLCGYKDEPTPVFTAPTGYTIRGDNAQDGVMADKSIAASGTETPAIFTGTGLGDNAARWAATLLLNPAGAASGGSSLTLQGVGKE